MMIRIAVSVLFVSLLASTAYAEEPAKPSRIQRRVERHNKDRSQAVKSKGRVLEIDTVVVQGRPGRPQAAVETSVQPFRFPVGTARYSEADQRFVKRVNDGTW